MTVETVPTTTSSPPPSPTRRSRPNNKMEVDSHSQEDQATFDLQQTNSHSHSYCEVARNGRHRVRMHTSSINSMDIDDDIHMNEDCDEKEEKKQDSDDAPMAFPQSHVQTQRRQRQRQREEEEEEEDEHREFQFNIANDANLQSIIHDNLSSSDSENGSFGFGENTNTVNIINNLHATANGHNGNLISSSANEDENELTAEYILSKLYNYMKISEMSKYGIHVFEMTFSSYLPYLNEAHLTKLATSYWCNGQHFKCMISHRGDRIKPISKNESSSASAQWLSSLVRSSDNDGKHERLQLHITSDLLDAAMQSGASVDKIEAMLLQKRIDKQMHGSNKKCKSTRNVNKFYQTSEERSFYLRNLKHRFWNHEVLVRVFIQNGWMNAKLADVALKTFINTIYHRVLQSKASMKKNKNVTENVRQGGGGTGVKFSETFLHSFFVSYFCLDDIPKMYRQEIEKKMRRQNGWTCCASQISEETLRRWCELIELLASRGANVAESEFKKVIPLQYALQLGKNTYKIISCSHKNKSEMLLPTQWNQENICVPDDIWDVLVSYL